MWTVSGAGSNPLSVFAGRAASIALATVVGLNATLEPTVGRQLGGCGVDAEGVVFLRASCSNAANIGLSGLGHSGSGIFAVRGVGRLPRRMSCSPV